MKGPHSLLDLLARTRRRSIAHLLLDKTALAAVIGMGGVILLLLLGTQILDWYWVALLAAASLGAGVYRLRKTIPSDYKVAQRLDRRLSLADTLWPRDFLRSGRQYGQNTSSHTRSCATSANSAYPI